MSLRRRAASRITWEVDRLINGFFDRLLNIDAAWSRPRGSIDPTKPSPYEASSYSTLREVERCLNLGPDDTFYDIGCGVGRSICYYAHRGISSVGVEFDRQLATRAELNIRSLRGPHSPVTVICEDATTVDYAGATAFYLFNPFPSEVLCRFLENIRSSNPGSKMRIAYCFPIHSAVIDQDECSSLYHTMSVRHLCQNIEIKFWEYVVPSAG